MERLLCILLIFCSLIISRILFFVRIDGIFGMLHILYSFRSLRIFGISSILCISLFFSRMLGILRILLISRSSPTVSFLMSFFFELICLMNSLSIPLRMPSLDTMLMFIEFFRIFIRSLYFRYFSESKGKFWTDLLVNRPVRFDFSRACFLLLEAGGGSPFLRGLLMSWKWPSCRKSFWA